METDPIESWLTLIIRNKSAYLAESRRLEVFAQRIQCKDDIFPSLISSFPPNHHSTGPTVRSRSGGTSDEGGSPQNQTQLMTINMDPKCVEGDTLLITAKSQCNQAETETWQGIGGRRHLLTWYEEHWSMIELVDRIYSSLIFRFSDVVLFYANNRVESIEHATTLVRWCKRSTWILNSEPHLSVVIIFTDLRHEKCEEFNDRANLITNIINTGSKFPSSHVSMACLPRDELCTEEQISASKKGLQLLISRLSRDVQEARVRSCTRFKIQDFIFLFRTACEHFSRTPSRSFDFVHASRHLRPVSLALEGHISELLKVVFEKEVLKAGSFVPSTLASALMLDAFPPGLHRFSGNDVFNSLYRGRVISAYNNVFPDSFATAGSTILEDILSATEKAFIDNCNKLKVRKIEVALLHRENILRSATEWRIVHCMSSCLSCLSNMSEHRLHGGHTLCSKCIMLLGEGDLDLPYQCSITHCPLCGYALESARHISVRPPTAGIRVVTFDGGGVRGILELELLQILEERLQFPVSKAFDLMVGTSTGGLIALGLGVNRWSVKQCKGHFENLLLKAFHQRQVAKVPLFGPLIELALSYITDSLYDTSYFEGALNTAFGDDELLFGKGTDDGLKTAAIATTVDSFPCVLSNYNGPGDRAKSRGYVNLTGNIMVHEAARSTSAAPFYHKSTRISCAASTASTVIGPLNLQDGGTGGMNNPVTIAVREAHYLNPTSSHQDLLISVGSFQLGTEDLLFGKKDPPSWISRMSTAFLRTFDCQRAWNENISQLQDSNPDHYHRLAVGFRGDLPFDDIKAVDDLKYAARSGFEGSEQLACIAHAVEAKCFFFELASTPAYELNYRCRGHIYCRLRAGSPELHKLVNRLAEATTQFILDDRPIAVVDHEVMSEVCMGRPFILECDFLVSNLDRPICIMLGGPERHPVSISSFPETVSWFIKTQGLNPPSGQEVEECGQRRKRPCPDYTAQCRKKSRT